MEIHDATTAFSALGHPGRLSVFRLLMRLAPQGGRPTEIAAALEMKPNTLSHHLNDLEACGLIRCARQGRSLFYSVDLVRAGGLVDYLWQDCCRGRPDLACNPAPSAGLQGAGRRPLNVLFLCSGNSARSIFAEAILNQQGAGRFRAFSAGTRAGGTIHPLTIEVLRRHGMASEALRSKPIAEFTAPDAPRMDFVFTVCDAAAAEECAPWPGQPITAHWGVADPVRATGTEAEKALAFAEAFAQLNGRITAFTALPIAELDRAALQGRVDTIGRPRT